MTKTEFLDKFFIIYDKLASLGAPGYTVTELSSLVSEAQESLINKKYGPNSNRLKEGFEETEKRIQEMGELVRYKTIPSSTFTTGFFPNSIFAKLPNTLIDNGPTDFSDVYWYTIFEDAITDKLDCTIPNNTTQYVRANIIEISHDEFNLGIKNPFRKPYVKGNDGKVLRLRSESRDHQLVTDGTFNITEYKVGYIRKPTPIDLATNLTAQVSELSDSFHRELLHETVEMAKSYVQDPSLAINLQTIKE
jgi:hypothetical protein